jgi:hypothetical protein
MISSEVTSIEWSLIWIGLFTIIVLDLLLLLLLIVFSPWASWAGTRAQSGDRYGSGKLHPGQVLRGSLPLPVGLLVINILRDYVTVSNRNHYNINVSNPKPFKSHLGKRGGGR